MTGGFAKYEALGNDYIVIDPTQSAISLTVASIALLCNRHHGIGADGILYGPFFNGKAISFRAFNSDGSECKKSGNGLRVFAHYLVDKGYVSSDRFELSTAAGEASVVVIDHSMGLFKTAMGVGVFQRDQIPASGPGSTLLDEELVVAGEKFVIGCVNVGNPQCVVLVDNCSSELAKRFGPLISRHAMFPLGINVQFVQLRDESNIEAEIWEHGSGYTLASGSSACAIACVLLASSKIKSEVTVHMPGGQLKVAINSSNEIFLTGNSSAVIDGQFSRGFLNRLLALG